MVDLQAAALGQPLQDLVVFRLTWVAQAECILEVAHSQVIPAVSNQVLTQSMRICQLLYLSKQGIAARKEILQSRHRLGDTDMCTAFRCQEADFCSHHCVEVDAH